MRKGYNLQIEQGLLFADDQILLDEPIVFLMLNLLPD